MFIHSVAHQTPETFIDQIAVEKLAEELFKNSSLDLDKYRPIFQNTEIDQRPILMPIEYYSKDKTFKEKNDLFFEKALELSEKSIRKCLEQEKISPEEIGVFILVTSSGFVTPTLDATLIDKLQLSTDALRLPLTGLGCCGGAYSLARAMEYSKIFPNKKILITTVETCTLTFRPSDKRTANLVALSLFSDGASSMVVSSIPKKNSIQVLNSKSRKWRNSLDVMGWEVANDGLQVIFDKSIPALILKYFKEFYEEFLNENGLNHKEMKHFLYHPGGMKVLKAFARCLEIELEQLKYSHKILKNFGNLSSPTIFFVIEEFLKQKEFKLGEIGTMTAMGPGFSSELLSFITT